MVRSCPRQAGRRLPRQIILHLELEHIGIQNGVIDRLVVFINRLGLHANNRIFSADMQEGCQLRRRQYRHY